MGKTKQFAIGIDPGLTETGIVLRGEKYNDIIAVRILACPPNGSALLRTTMLADAIMLAVDGMIDTAEATLDNGNNAIINIVIETPIYNNNPTGFELQWRLVQELEATYISNYAGSNLTLTEVHNKTSKHLATRDGGAGKASIAKASPFDRKDFPTQSTFYTAADAWAHSLAARDGQYMLNLNRMSTIDFKYPEVVNVFSRRFT